MINQPLTPANARNPVGSRKRSRWIGPVRCHLSMRCACDYNSSHAQVASLSKSLASEGFPIIHNILRAHSAESLLSPENQHGCDMFMLCLTFLNRDAVHILYTPCPRMRSSARPVTRLGQNSKPHSGRTLHEFAGMASPELPCRRLLRRDPASLYRGGSQEA